MLYNFVNDRYKMFAIINVGGRQFKVKKGSYFTINSATDKVGDNIVISDVRMFCKDGKLLTGESLKGCSVECEITESKKGKKIIIFKSKQRDKGRKKAGYRPYEKTYLVKQLLFSSQVA